MPWDKPPSHFKQVIEQDVESLSNEVTLYIHRHLVFGSAVDTGRYRGNHQITINRRPSLPVSGFSSQANGAIERGTRELVSGKGKPYRVVFISNNLPYAQKLEDDHPQFAGNYARAFNNAVVRYANG